jgi:hypothetical protein
MQVLSELQLNLRLGASERAAVVAQEFEGCTFLFAKLVGLRHLVESADPRWLLELLQTTFDRFDTLAETFSVQRVRKTVNESYMVAAGLPCSTLLRSPVDRALATAGFGLALCGVMDVLNAQMAQRMAGGKGGKRRAAADARRAGGHQLGLGNRGRHRPPAYPVRPGRRRRQHRRAHVLLRRARAGPPLRRNLRAPRAALPRHLARPAAGLHARSGRDSSLPPLRRCASAPLRLCTSAPLHLCTSVPPVPLHRCAAAPLHLCAACTSAFLHPCSAARCRSRARGS